MKLIYAPFSIAAGVVGARAGRKVFGSIWSMLSDSPKPPPTAAEQGLVRVAAAAALEGATLAAAAAVTHQLAARAFHELFGAWPGKQRQRAQSAE